MTDYRMKAKGGHIGYTKAHDRSAPKAELLIAICMIVTFAVIMFSCGFLIAAWLW